MEYKLDGATVRVHTQHRDQKYRISHGVDIFDVPTFGEAEAKIRGVVKEALDAETKRVALNLYKSGGFPSDTEKASYELDAYKWVRNLVFDLGVPAAVYGRGE